jgi:uncharacterized DUF497 family protein
MLFSGFTIINKNRVNYILNLALGTTDSGRYLTVYFLYKKNKEALIVTARDMTEKERKKYAKK